MILVAQINLCKRNKSVEHDFEINFFTFPTASEFSYPY